MDPGSGETAARLLARLPRGEIARILREYGDERLAWKIAGAIERGPPQTTLQLAEICRRAYPRGYQRIDPATRTFQALRIAVNDELETVRRALPAAVDLLRPGGRLAVISFHSLEDRIVKQFFKLASTGCICPPQVPVCVCGHRASVRPLTRKPVMADADEVARNPRSRSARLRVVERLAL